MYGKRVLITGCSSGIGLSAARGLKARGYQVLVTARKMEDLAMLRSEGFEVFHLELSDPESVTKCMEEVRAACDGKLYAVFHNAGYGQAGALEDVPREALARQFEGNVFGAHQMNRQLIQWFRAQGHGRIIYNSSVLGLVAMPMRGAYNASKYAIEGLADTLRQELRKSGIWVSLIEPGPIASQFRVNAQQTLDVIDIAASVHQKQYEKAQARLAKKGPAAPFTLPADAVLKPLIHALEAPIPRAHYRVTLPTKLFAILKRLLPSRWLDKVLIYASGREAT